MQRNTRSNASEEGSEYAIAEARMERLVFILEEQLKKYSEDIELLFDFSTFSRKQYFTKVIIDPEIRNNLRPEILNPREVDLSKIQQENNQNRMKIFDILKDLKLFRLDLQIT